MKPREIFSMAVQEEYCQRKYTRLTLIFMALSLILIIGVSSIVGSVKASTEDLLNQPFGRVIYIPGNQSTIDTYKETLSENMKNNPVIGDVFECSAWQPVYWNDSKELTGRANQEILVDAWFSGLDDYLTDGSRQPEYGEIVLPEKLYNIGIYDSYNYVDTSSLIGKNIMITIDASDSTNSWTETMLVVGTYDNLTSNSQTKFLVSGSQMAAWYQQRHKITEEEIVQEKRNIEEQGLANELGRQIEENYSGDEQAFWQDYFGVQTNICIYVNSGYSMEQAEELLQKLIGTKGVRALVLDKGLILYFNFIIYMGNLAAILLLTAAFANILIIVTTEMRRRQGEFALKQSMGYRKYQILVVFGLGKFLCFLKAVCLSVLVTVILSLGGNYVIGQTFPFYLRHIRLTIEPSSLAVSLMVVAFGAVLGLVPAAFLLGKINITSVLKREEQV